MAELPEENERDPVDAVIILAGFIVGGFILMGFILGIASIYKWKPAAPVVTSTSTLAARSETVVTQSSSNTRVVPMSSPAQIPCEKCITLEGQW
jgi:hypothetical protein